MPPLLPPPKTRDSSPGLAAGAVAEVELPPADGVGLAAGAPLGLAVALAPGAGAGKRGWASVTRVGVVDADVEPSKLLCRDAPVGPSGVGEDGALRDAGGSCPGNRR